MRLFKINIFPSLFSKRNSFDSTSKNNNLQDTKPSNSQKRQKPITFHLPVHLM